MKKLLIGAAALSMIATPIAASAEPFGRADGARWSHDDGRRWGDRDERDGGAALAAGLFGLFLGSAIASGHAYDYPPAYAVRCHWQTSAYPGPYGSVTYQQVRVCY